MKVWMLARDDGSHWVPDRLYTSRESALAAIPEGSEHVASGDDEHWDPAGGEHWIATAAPPYWGARLRIEDWEVTP